MKRLIALILSFACSSAFAAGSSTYNQGQSQENQGREFIMSCTYGVMAGTLVGVASLAFTSQPSENLNRVARGASIGLYLGIALGLYVVYVVPGMEEENAEQEPVARRFMVTPMFASSGGHDGIKIDGARADATILRF